MWLFNSHYNIGIYMSMQSIRCITISERTNVCYVFIDRVGDPKERRYLYEQYAEELYATQEAFEEVLDALNRRNECMVIECVYRTQVYRLSPFE